MTMSRIVTVHSGFRPYAHQRDLIKLCDNAFGSGKTIVVKARRQVGKSVSAENIVLRYCVNFGKSTKNYIVEPTLNQSRRVYKDICKMLVGTPLLKRNNDALLELELANGSMIYFKSAEQKDNLRGETCTGILIIDEAAYVRDDVFNECLVPWTNVHNAPILLISTPKLRKGFFYEYWERGLQGDPSIDCIDFGDYDLSMLLSDERKAMYRQMLPKNAYLTEIEGKFLDSDSSLFTNIRESVKPSTKSSSVYVGIDWATSGSDNTVVTFINQDGSVVEQHAFNDMSSLQQIQAIKPLFTKYDTMIRRIYAESNSVGSPLNELLQKELSGMKCSKAFRSWTTTNRTKIDQVSHLQCALEDGTIGLPDDEKLIDELSTYEATVNPRTGSVSYNAAPPNHDDRVMSLMLAYEAYLDGGVSQYHISIR